MNATGHWVDAAGPPFAGIGSGTDPIVETAITGIGLAHLA